jgi:uncharacterized repeat protein (TIGR04076 family)
MANGSFLGQKVKITVMRKLKLDDLAREYGQIRPGTEDGDAIPSCPFFEVGQEFIVRTGGDEDCKPKGFCDWAWADLWKDVLMVANKAGMCPDGEKSKQAPQFTCCTDGLRPVIFKVESMEVDGEE